MSDLKRSQPAIPLSPPSPPAEGVKQSSESLFAEYAPRSPASPYMSTATKSYGQSFTQSSSSIPSAAQRSPSPPTSAPMSAQGSQQPGTNSTTSHPRPENSVIGLTRKVPDEFDEEHVSKRIRLDGEDGSKEVKGSDAHHSRLSGQSVDFSSTLIADSQSTLPLDHTQDLSNDVTQPATDESNLESKDLDGMFLLGKSAIPRLRPNLSEHLLSKFGLETLHAQVARIDPHTGEKINKLRKSYEGHVKMFELPGKNKTVKDDIPEGELSSLNQILQEPPESWYATKVMGKEIKTTPEFEARLRSVFQFEPGRVRNHDKWGELLGIEKPRPLAGQDSLIKQKGSLPRPHINGIHRPVHHSEGIRPRRANKRSYADNSFEGYGDGFVDDSGAELDSSFLSGSEDGGGGSATGPARKRRKRERVGSLRDVQRPEADSSFLQGSGTSQSQSQSQSHSQSVQYPGGSGSYGVGGW